jgi:8-oxo-dGDP phosphatase
MNMDKDWLPRAPGSPMKTLASRVAYETPWLRVRQDQVERQWRYPWQRDSWELPAGRCEAGEKPLDGAQRELREETGVTARTWRQLCTYYGSASIATQFHYFLATGIEEGTTARDVEEADMVVSWIPLEEAVKGVMDGRIVHSSAIGGILRLDHLARAGEL